jgi:hypothetical protein
MDKLELLLKRAEEAGTQAANKVKETMQLSIQSAEQSARAKVLGSGLESHKDALYTAVQKVGDPIFSSGNASNIRRFHRDISKVIEKYSADNINEPRQSAPLKKDATPTRDPRYTQSQVKSVARYVRAEVKPGERIEVDTAYKSFKSRDKKIARDTLYDILGGPLKESGLVIQNGKRGRFTRKYKASATELIPAVKQAFKDHGYVSSAMLVAQGHGSRENLRGIGRALYTAVNQATDDKVKSFEIESGKLNTTYKIFHVGKEPDMGKLIE